MSRRFGAGAFLVLAALVFAVLGWVTVAALRVERAQRESAARAELGNNLRVALWRLDGRMLPALGVEDNRPFHHYGPADPLAGNTTGPTPLLAAPLPDWMALHVQLDPQTGWDSPQVLPSAACARVNDAWPDFPLRNSTDDRAATFRALRARHPAPAALDWFAARAGTALEVPDAPEPPALPGTAALVVPPLPSIGKPAPGDPASEGNPAQSFRIFGWELGGRAKEQQAALPQAPPVPQQQQAFQQQLAGGKANPPPNPGGRGQGRTGKSDFDNRSEIIQRGVQDAKAAGADFPQFNNNRFNGYQQGLSNSANPLTPDQCALLDRLDKLDRELLAENGKLQNADQLKKLAERMNDEVARGRAAEALVRVPVPTGGWVGRVAARALDAECRRSVRELDELKKQSQGAQPQAPSGPASAPPGAKLVAPAEERPMPLFLGQGQGFFGQGQGGANSLNWLANNILVGPPATHVHLGSMRPVWLAAADGTDSLVLVRAAKLDTKTVYQGVVLDWPKLEALLKEEVADLFPAARLVPVKDPAAVVPERAMTALPVQLDPGPDAPPPPAGWTPLRIGLTVAWVAGLVAFAAVAFSGWSLVDLAERRIRFVSAVTHELRTPLTSLRLYLDLLMSGMIHDEAKRQEYLQTLAGESDRLHRLIDNVLDFAKLEKRRASGDMKPEKVADLLALLRATWTDRVALDGRELVVVSTLPPDAEVVTDAAMVQQIVGNLIDNARKYSKDAADRRIWVWAKPAASGVAFEVEDRGPGVPAGERKAIFQPFRRGATADTVAGGAGLGLALAKQWAEVLGGALSYRPAHDAPGACFRLELPR
jgi:signal transduction histidine kinase